MGKYDLKPKSNLQTMGNINAALQAFQKDGLRVVSSAQGEYVHVREGEGEGGRERIIV